MIRSVLDIAQTEHWNDRTWTLLGKGPSLDSYLSSRRTMSERLMGLNHVCQRITVDVAHVIDIEVIADIDSANFRYLLMPWMPNRKHRRGNSRLPELLDEYPLLKNLDSNGRLLAYNRTGSIVCVQGFVYASAKHFSSEAALDVLGACGVKRVVTAGIDGGKTYAAAFEGMKPLSNGRQSFDAQLPELEKIAKKHKMTVERFAP